MTGHDPRDLPNYTLAEAARWLAIRPSTLRVWLLGKNYQTKQGARKSPPVVRPAQVAPLVLSFWNLVECSVLGSMRSRHDVPLQQVRRALAYVAKELKIQRPLIDQDFSTDGVALFVEKCGKLVDASSHGQLAMHQVIAAGLTRIERDAEGLAARLFPWRRSPEEPKVVAVDPKIAFGQPILFGTRVPVQVLFDRFRAGDSLAHLAEEYQVEPAILEEAVRGWFGPAAA